MLENVFLVLSGLLALTLLEGYSLIINIAILTISMLLYVLRSDLLQKRSIPQNEERSQESSSRKQFVQNFRAFMNIATIMSILAVDFPIFPRRLAKCEVYGKGLLDIGVGSFIFSHGLVSPMARGKVQNGASKLGNILKNVTGCFPIIFIGILRLISVKATGYQEHETEYGVHWNFFFTLAFVKVTLLNCYN